MYCSKCGNKLDENSSFCGKCGYSVNKNNDKKPKKYISLLKNKKVLIITIIIIAFILLYFIIMAIGKNNLSKELQKDWVRVETGEKGTTYKLVLDFSDNKIVYNFESGLSILNTTIGTYNYKVVGFNKIEVIADSENSKNKTYKIEFNNDKTSMTITPALTNVDAEETWYYIDD